MIERDEIAIFATGLVTPKIVASTILSPVSTKGKEAVIKILVRELTLQMAIKTIPGESTTTH
jgi:hypothetical protein